MKMTFEMPEVVSCNARNCAYNKGNTCHARAITVGDGTIPECDTFFNSTMHNHSTAVAGVGACKVSECKYNHDFECHAPEVNIKIKDRLIQCDTCDM